MEKTRVAGERVMSDLKTLVSDAESLLNATAADVSEKAKEARARLTEALDRAKSTCETLQSQSMDTGRNALRKTDATIRDRPYESLALVLGAGVVIGWLIGRGER